jgi:hypothetical protein
MADVRTYDLGATLALFCVQGKTFETYAALITEITSKRKKTILRSRDMYILVPI